MRRCATFFHGEIKRHNSSQFQADGSMRLSHLFDYEFDSPRQLQAHQKHPVELGVSAHALGTGTSFLVPLSLAVNLLGEGASWQPGQFARCDLDFS